MKLINLAIFSIMALLLTACGAKIAPMSEQESLSLRAAQIKDYELSKTALLRASIASLQDFDFAVDGFDLQAGFISGIRYAAGGITHRINLVVISKTNKQSQIRASIFYRDVIEEMDESVFGEIDRSIKNDKYLVKSIRKAQVYQNFFNTLNKSVFFEQEGL